MTIRMEKRPQRVRRPRRLGLLMLAWCALAIRLALGAGAEAPLETHAQAGPLAALAAATVDCGPPGTAPKTPAHPTDAASLLLALDHDAAADAILPPIALPAAPIARLAVIDAPWWESESPRLWRGTVQARAPPAAGVIQSPFLMTRPV